MSIAPLFLKYRTPSGKCYIYDSGTSEIVCVEEILYHILDDYHVLNEQELMTSIARSERRRLFDC